MKLQGKVVLVTGGVKRIGREIALALAERGAKVAVHYNRSEKEAKALG
ncbi:MAG: SDR family NAD(P)-dependent oxidoreductase, partial [Deltaproteobacteria bacterium]|nr:SDR family NAD(P)-dependent oxidoreductase [Deltaproteobacteria bacterium]